MLKPQRDFGGWTHQSGRAVDGDPEHGEAPGPVNGRDQTALEKFPRLDGVPRIGTGQSVHVDDCLNGAGSGPTFGLGQIKEPMPGDVAQFSCITQDADCFTLSVGIQRMETPSVAVTYAQHGVFTALAESGRAIVACVIHVATHRVREQHT